jgi:4'-phosphopantetheinyl transferase
MSNCPDKPSTYKVHVWGVSLSGISESGATVLASMCSAAEQEKSARFIFDRDRWSYLAAHGLLRHALSRYDPTHAPSEWSFRGAPHGRPELAEHLCSRLRFNLSHCSTRAICVVCSDLDCGIDVELMSQAINTSFMRERCLSRREQRWLASFSAELQEGAFLQLWTLKEAVAKAVGLGLNISFGELDLEVSDPPRLRSAPLVAACPWWLAQHQTQDGHIEALALRVDRADAIELSRYEWTG